MPLNIALSHIVRHQNPEHGQRMLTKGGVPNLFVSAPSAVEMESKPRGSLRQTLNSAADVSVSAVTRADPTAPGFGPK